MDRFPGSGFAGHLAKLSGRFSPNWRQTTGAFFVVLAVAFYLRAWKKQDRVRMSAAFLAMPAAWWRTTPRRPMPSSSRSTTWWRYSPRAGVAGRNSRPWLGSRRRLCSPGSAGASPRTACTAPLRPRLKLQRQRLRKAIQRGLAAGRPIAEILRELDSG
jgi:hypothetical protein